MTNRRMWNRFMVAVALAGVLAGARTGMHALSTPGIGFPVLPDMKHGEGDDVTVAVAVTGFPDVTYSATGLPPGVTITTGLDSIGRIVGILSGTLLQGVGGTDPVTNAGSYTGAEGVYSVTVSASDGSVSNSFTWDIGRWGAGDLFVGAGTWTYRVYDKNGNFKKDVVTPDDPMTTWGVTAGCAANWHTGEVWAANFDDIRPAVNVITRHAAGPGLPYTDITRRLSTERYGPVGSYSIDGSPESVGFDNANNMYVTHSAGFYTDAGDFSDINGDPIFMYLDGDFQPTTYDGPNAMLLYVDAAGAPIRTGDNSLVEYGTWWSPDGYYQTINDGNPVYLLDSLGARMPVRDQAGMNIHKYPMGVDGYSDQIRSFFDTRTSGRSGTDQLDILSDQRTAIYTSESYYVYRYDLQGAGAQLPVLGSTDINAPAIWLNRETYGLRALPPGDGTGGYLIVTDVGMYRTDATGRIVQNYGINNDADYEGGVVTGWFQLAVAPDGRSFWAATRNDVYHFDLASGARIGEKIHATDGDMFTNAALAGLCVMNEYRAAQEVCGANGLGNFIDDDLDGVIDDGCFRVEICSISNPGDDDGDGLVDFNDPDCDATTQCSTDGPTDGSVAGFCDRANNEFDEVAVPSAPLPCPGCSEWTFNYTATGLPPGLSIDPGTGDISGRPLYTIVEPNNALSPPVVYNVHVTGTWEHTGSPTITLDHHFDWTIYNTNRAPLALNDAATAVAGGSVMINVQSNDTDGDGDSIGFAPGSLTQPSNGSVTIVGQQLQYTAPLGFGGVVTFTYRVQDTYAPVALSNVATVTVVVNGSPVAVNDTYHMAAGTTLTTTAADGLINNIWSRDTDPENQSLTVVSGSVSVPTSGSVTVNPDGSFSYTPAPGFVGTATFTYRVTNGLVSSNTATVTIVVHAPPVAQNDSYTTFMGIPVVRGEINGLLINDSDPEGGQVWVVLTSVTAPSHGTVVPGPFGDGSFTYTPFPLFVGTDTFTYRVINSRFESNTATVTITVRATNHAPTAQDDFFSAEPGVMLSVPAGAIMANDSDPDGDALSAEVLSGPDADPGTFSFTNGSGAFQYTSSPSFVGVVTFQYRVRDPFGLSSPLVKVHIRVHRRPVAVNNSYTTAEDTPLTVSAAAGLLPNDIDADHDPLQVVTSTVTSPSHGAVSVNANGSFTYTPASNFSGTDSFTYQVTDGSLTSNFATVTITITSVNDLPTAGNDTFTTPEDTATTGTVAANDTTGEGANVWTLLTSTTNGTLTFTAIGGFTYVPALDFNGTDTFTYKVCDVDNDCATATATITITPVNDLPVAANDSFTGTEDTLLNGTVAGNDTLSGDGGNVWTLATGALHGTVTVNADGSFVYMPAANYNGADSFVYRLCDATPDCVTATATISIAPVNDLPATDDDFFTTAEDTATAGSVTGNDTLSGDGGNAFAIVTGASNGTVTMTAATGAFTYLPAANYNGADVFTYRLCDVNNDCSTATVSITIAPVNDLPLAANDTFWMGANTVLTANVAGNDTASGDGGNVWTAVTVPASGLAVLTPTGGLTYTPVLGFSGTVSFTYDVCDINADCSTATVTITVLAAATGGIGTGDTATIGFWQNNNGQALIKSLNGGPNATNLGNWLATNFPYLWGANATAANNLTGNTNTQVAAYDLTLFNSDKKFNQVLGGALAAYVTNSSLSGGSYSAGYGFNVSASGTGSRTYNVGSNGTAVGLANKTSYTVFQLLLQANLRKQQGNYNTNAFNVIFDGINQKGDIK